MATPANTLNVDDPAIRESLADVIINYSPRMTPFFKALTRKRARSYIEQELVDDFNTHNTTARPYGNVYEFSERRNPERRQFVLQSIDDGYRVADEENQSRHAGFARRTLYEDMKHGIEQKIAIEKILVQLNQASDQPDSGNNFTGKTASLMAHFETNTVKNSAADTTAGADGGWDKATKEFAARTDADPTVAFTEQMLVDALNSLWKESEHGLMGIDVMMNLKQKQAFDKFTGITEFRTNLSGAGQAAIHAAADTYRHDAGTVKTMLNRWMRDRDVFCINRADICLYQYWMFRTTTLAKRGSLTERAIASSFALAVKGEKRHAGIFDLS